MAERMPALYTTNFSAFFEFEHTAVLSSSMHRFFTSLDDRTFASLRPGEACLRKAQGFAVERYIDSLRGAVLRQGLLRWNWALAVPLSAGTV
jgi:hypothetical protein